MKSGDWCYSLDYKQSCKVIENVSLWNETFCRVWFPASDTVVKVKAQSLTDKGASSTSSQFLTYIAAAARVADALTQDVLLAPIESSVIPLPHQIKALSLAVSGDKIRYLLADEVGLGKTIEAGLIMRELKLRGMIRRILIVAPKGLVTQWVSEMRLHFSEDFKLVLPEDIKSIKRFTTADNPWQAVQQVICPMDSVKPLDQRKGWTKEQVDQFNEERFTGLVSAGWDLIIVDEAHRLGGSTDQVARFKLGQGLAESSPYILLLSATPHQGKTDAFLRIMSLLDAQAFPDSASIRKERVESYVIRTEKRKAIDAEGQPLFKPRQTRLQAVEWQDRHERQRLLYEAITSYVREGYNQAIKEKRNYIGFLMILMQRLATSSIRAIRTTLERRLEVLELPEEPMSLFPVDSNDWAEMDGQDQLEVFLTRRFKAMRNERAEVKTLLDAARQVESQGPDTKAEALLELVYRLQQEEADPSLKVLIFTEFVPTQTMLAEFLRDRGFSVACLNGSMGMEERQRVQERFANDCRVLVSTDAGGEGLNLQFCHVVVNYDIPWNPMRLEQRIGRVDRIGQNMLVKAFNLVLQDTVEYRVRDVLEEKLAVILQDFGVDKAGDVLDSTEAEQLFDTVFIEALRYPDSVDSSVDKLLQQVREQAQKAMVTSSLLSSNFSLDPQEAKRMLEHPLIQWVERMTIAWLECHGGNAQRTGNLWELTWPDGTIQARATFKATEALGDPTLSHISLETPRIRGLTSQLPLFVPGQPVPCVRLASLSGEISGFWGLCRISLKADEWQRQRIVPVFLHDDGRTLLPTARHIWDMLIAESNELHSYLDTETSGKVYDRIFTAAEALGRDIYDELAGQHASFVNRERVKAEYAFAARKRNIEKIGLPTVRLFRLKQLEEEERKRFAIITGLADTMPDMTMLVILRIGAGNV